MSWTPIEELEGVPSELVERLFDASDPGSAWSRALDRLGIARDARVSWIRWENGSALWNQEALSSALARPGAWRSLALQWRVERWLSALERTGVPSDAEQARIDSLTLGLGLVALTLRLPRAARANLGSWLADPDTAPRSARSTLRRMIAVQALRTRYSWAWEPLLEHARSPDPHDGPAPETAFTAAPVCPGRALGTLLFASPMAPGERERIARVAPPRIIVFERAVPRSTELFDLAAGVVFLRGGLLAHACVIARERSLACVTEARGVVRSMEGRLAELDVTPTTARLRLID